MSKLNQKFIGALATIGGTGLVSSIITALVVTKSNRENYETSEQMKEEALEAKAEATKIFERIVKEKEEMKKIKTSIEASTEKADKVLKQIKEENRRIEDAQTEIISKFKDTNKEMIEELKNTIKESTSLAIEDILNEAKKAKQDINKNNQAEDEIAADLEEHPENGKKGGRRKK